MTAIHGDTLVMASLMITGGRSAHIIGRSARSCRVVVSYACARSPRRCLEP